MKTESRSQGEKTASRSQEPGARRLTLDRLSKQELLSLIQRCPFSFNDRDIAIVRFDSMCARANRMADEAQAEAEASRGIDNFPRYVEAIKKINRAMKMWDRAGKILESKSHADL